MKNRVSEFQSSKLQRSTSEPLNPATLEPVKRIVSRIIDVT